MAATTSWTHASHWEMCFEPLDLLPSVLSADQLSIARSQCIARHGGCTRQHFVCTLQLLAGGFTVLWGWKCVMCCHGNVAPSVEMWTLLNEESCRYYKLQAFPTEFGIYTRIG